MLERIDDLPSGIDGIRATGTVTKDDYERVFEPLVESAYREGRRLRLLYQFAPEFRGFTAGAGLEDAYLGTKYLRLFERCAIATDHRWIREGTRIFGALMPCPVRVFENRDRQQAVHWLSAPAEDPVPHRLLREEGVLVVEPSGRLRSEDFDALADTVDPWIEAEGSLRGIVVHAQRFPGWESLDSLLQHLRFVRDHHRHVERVAVAVDGTAGDLAARLTGPFVHAELRRFGYDQLGDAVAWAGSGAPPAAH